MNSVNADSFVAKLDLNTITGTPRRPDVRMIVKNTSDHSLSFKNPGNHSDQLEVIPPGQAFMIMPNDESLVNQFCDCEDIDLWYCDTNSNADLLDKLINDYSGLLDETNIKEMYGPCNFDEQVRKLEIVSWADIYGDLVEIKPFITNFIAYGARKPTTEKVIGIIVDNQSNLTSLSGTNTVAERFTNLGNGTKKIFVKIEPVLDDKWQPTGQYKTAPIVVSVAEKFYGNNVENIPTFRLNTETLELS